MRLESESERTQRIRIRMSGFEVNCLDHNSAYLHKVTIVQFTYTSTYITLIIFHNYFL